MKQILIDGPRQIRFLERKEIDAHKWNRCILCAGNGLVYAYTDYLDAMADTWGALLLDDYKMVMPLAWRKKWGVHYLYQPFLTAQLGVFGNGITAEAIAAFFNAVPPRFRYWDISLNHQNLFPVAGYPLYERMNFVLPLNTSYESLYAGYRENVRRNIRKSKTYGCMVETETPMEEIIQLTKLQAAETPEHDFNNFRNLFGLLKEQGQAKTYGVRSGKGDLLASAAFLFSNNRAYYLLVGNHPNGRTLGASHTLIDTFIRDYAGRDLLLDFEGSDIRNLQFFYSSFGAREEKYAAMKLNRLPWWVRWMKG